MKVCSKCGLTLELKHFYSSNSHSSGKRNDCKMCVGAYIKAVKAKVVASGKCATCCRENDGCFKCCSHCRAKSQLAAKAFLAREKDITFMRYGGYRCACCGETERVFLSIDHINNDGGSDRRKSKIRNICQLLKQRGYPSGYQVLCFNCNWAKSHGGCPHQKGVVALPC